MRLACLLLSIFLPTLITSTSLFIVVPPSAHIPSPAALPSSTTASLTTFSITHRAFLNSENTFRFRNVSAGSYLLSIQCATHAFAPLRIDVSDDGTVNAWRTFRGNGWDNKGEAMNAGKGIPVEVRALGAKDYYMERAGFSPLSLLKNPMILIAGFGMLMVFGIPYLIDSMDPEMRAEFEERQKSSSTSGLLAGAQPGANPLGDFDAAAWLAGAGKKSEGTVDRYVDKHKEKGVRR